MNSKTWRGIRVVTSALDHWGIATTTGLVLILAAMVVINVVLRYGFNNPWFFVEEYSGYIVVALTFLGLGYILKTKGHITLDVVTNRLRDRVKTGLMLATILVSLVTIGVMFGYSLQLALKSIWGNLRASTVMMTPLWIPQIVIAVGLLIFGLEMLMQLVTTVGDLINPSRASHEDG